MRRRDLLASGAGVALTAGAAPAAAPGRPVYGESYELLGKRLIFTNWHYIRPGSFAWRDESGNAVGLTFAVPAGAAHFTAQDQPQGIRLHALPAQRMGPLFEAEASWKEGAGVALTTVIHDQRMYRGWGAPFTTSGDPPGQKHFYYLESKDGLSWKRPDLVMVEANPSRSRGWLPQHYPHLGTDSSTASPHPLRRARRRTVARPSRRSYAPSSGRTRKCFAVSGPLHASRRHIQPPVAISG